MRRRLVFVMTHDDEPCSSYVMWLRAALESENPRDTFTCRLGMVEAIQSSET